MDYGITTGSEPAKKSRNPNSEGCQNCRERITLDTSAGSQQLLPIDHRCIVSMYINTRRLNGRAVERRCANKLRSYAAVCHCGGRPIVYIYVTCHYDARHILRQHTNYCYVYIVYILAAVSNGIDPCNLCYWQQILPTVDFFLPTGRLTITGLDRTYCAHHFIFSFTF